MRMVSIASGSSGNCIYIGSDNTHLLVDAGISNKRIQEGLNDIGLTGSDVTGILVTHEHSDHIKGVGVLARRYGFPIYATQGTIDQMKGMSSLGAIDEGLYHTIRPDETFSIGDVEVEPFHISHDAADPVAYRFESNGKSAAVATDMGIYNDYIVEHLKGLDVVLLEANHDIQMLQVGPYPYPLKQRILGERGHLSNDLSGQLLGKVLHDGFKKVILGHLSKENNFPELALKAVQNELERDFSVTKETLPVSVAPRDEAMAIITL